MRTTLFQPDLLYREGRFVAGQGLAVGPDGEVAPGPAEGAELCPLPGRALLPGLVNAHSHAFQRLLRGRTEYRAGAKTDFWSWRELMYRLAETLGPEELYRASRQAFLEMALSGITTVGEFHYLHHAPGGQPYRNRNEIAEQVIRAAREVGLRVVLLRAGYGRGGFGLAPEKGQLRFIDPELEDFLGSASGLRATFREDSLVQVGLAPHSVRAVERSWLEELARLPKELVHMHVAEQPGEIETCQAEHGLRPVELLEQVGLLRPGFTAVHAVWLNPQEVSALGRSGAAVCACPSTERNLGDGVVPADQLFGAGVALSLGTDSQVGIDLLEDARELESHLRLLRGRRAVLDPGGGQLAGLAARLFDSATRAGARSLGLAGGELSPGAPADFFTVDLNHPSLAGAGAESLLPHLVFSAQPGAVQEVAVGGQLIVFEGKHLRQEAIISDYQALVRALSW